MSDTMVADPVTDVLARLEADLDALSSAELGSCTDTDLLDAWQRLETVTRRLAPVDHAVIGEVEARSLPFTCACKNSAALARHLLRITPGEAHARVKAAHALGQRRTLTGERLAPGVPCAAAAQAAGELSARHAQVITDTITKLPGEIAAEVGPTVERVLTDFARGHDPAQLAGHARDLAHALDQDGQYDEAKHRERTRGLWLRRRTDGSARLEGELTAECAEHLASQLDALGKPDPADEHGVADQRSAAQRRHDAFLAMLKLVERAELLPHAGGVSATILLTMPAEAYATGTGTATTGHGYTVPADLAKDWAGPEARVLGAVLSRTRGILAYSSQQRIFTEQQRLAVIARDSGCSFPGCDAPPQRCEVHHVTEYRDSHRTSVDDAALLCSYNHRNFEQQGWTCQMIDGRPWWTPPKWLDPDQVPRRNTMHDHHGDPAP